MIESLVALAVTAMIVFSTAALVHDGAFFFDRGTRAVDQTEQFALAVDCLTRDLAAARFVLEIGARGPTAAFTGDGQGRALFITSGGRAPGPQGEEVVEYSVDRNDAGASLVRRRSPWTGPRMRLDDAELRDPVVLLSGAFDISFEFLDSSSPGALVWQDEWTNAKTLPHSMRLKLLDRSTGVDLLAGRDFLIRANAPLSCASGKDDCLSLGKAAPSTADAAGSQSQDQAKTP